MAFSLKRRDFIKTASLLGASIIVENPLSGRRSLSGNDGGEIKNDYFTASFDSEKGTIDIFRSNGIPLITGETFCANSTIGKRSISSGNYKTTLDATAFRDQLGAWKRMLIFSYVLVNNLVFEIQLSLYDHLAAVTIEAICKNVSAHDIVIHSLEPIRVIKTEGGISNVPGVSKCITNGAMFHNAGTVHAFGT